jgi:transposase
MEYFAGLDVSMAETQVCVMGRNGAVIHKAKVPSTPADIAAELARLPTCRRIVFETGRMAPMLYHGLRQLGAGYLHREPAGVSGAEAISDTQDRPQRCARSGAFGTNRVLQARLREVPVGTCGPVSDHRSQEAGRASGHSREPDPRLAVVFGVRLPRGLSSDFIRQALQASDGIPGLSAAMQGLVAARTAVLAAIVLIDGDIRRDGQSVRGVPTPDEHSRCRATHGPRIHSGS